MFRQLHEIKGMQVITLTEGRVMGSVQKVYLNPTKKRVAGMVVREPGFGGQESWVEIKDIDKVGEHVIFINRAAMCKAKAPVGRSLKDLMGMQVTSKDGKILGSLVDIEIDQDWRVTELNLSEGRVVKIDPRHAVFGQDAILLRAGAASQVRPAPRHKTGFLARVFGIETVQETAGAISRAEKTTVPESRKTVPKPKKTKSRTRKS
jgi:sporulation protein YlmC with PRC-barrel domain